MLLLGRDGRYLSLATDPRFGYRSFPKVFPGGSIAHGEPAPPRQGTARLGGRSVARRIANVLLLKKSPLEVARNYILRKTLDEARRATGATEIGAGMERPAKQAEQPVAAKTA